MRTEFLVIIAESPRFDPLHFQKNRMPHLMKVTLYVITVK